MGWSKREVPFFPPHKLGTYLFYNESLAATIRTKRPELLANIAANASPIPSEIPQQYRLKHSVPSIPDIGEPINACVFSLSNIDPKKWYLQFIFFLIFIFLLIGLFRWMFEKYDGVRGFWNPSQRAFYSRTGSKFNLPSRIVDAMPTSTFLDGEFWYEQLKCMSGLILFLRFGVDNFNEAQKISSRTDESNIDWQSFRYMVFDIPDKTGLTYEQRYNLLGKTIYPFLFVSFYLTQISIIILEDTVKNSTGGFLQLAAYEVCRDAEHLESFYQDVMDRGGEGIILRNPETPLQAGRSAAYLKHKVIPPLSNYPYHPPPRLR